MKQWSYINSAAQIIGQYNGQEPFAVFLKKYFSQHKKFGSKDRKQVSHLCYCYFRLGKSLLSLSAEERILLGLFFCSAESNEILAVLRPDWNDKVNLKPEEKCSLFNDPELVEGCSKLSIFPWKEELTGGIEHERFAESFFVQPDLFLRLRPGKENRVKQKLQNAGIEFRVIKDDCIALSNSSRLDELIEMNKEAVVQDYSSQRVGELLLPVTRERQAEEVIRVWDCCAASGGKSIMLYDINPAIDLTVSDIRESILINLRKRFTEAGIRKYKTFSADLSATGFKQQQSDYDLIICDAPCTGSGTWSRTPEQLFYFDVNKIDNYSSLQKQIVSNTIPFLKKGGHFLYITCSVFKKENEEIVNFIKRKFALDMIRTEVIKGYGIKADTMFAALFRKPGTN